MLCCPYVSVAYNIFVRYNYYLFTSSVPRGITCFISFRATLAFEHLSTIACCVNAHHYFIIYFNISTVLSICRQWRAFDKITAQYRINFLRLCILKSSIKKDLYKKFNCVVFKNAQLLQYIDYVQCIRLTKNKSKKSRKTLVQFSLTAHYQFIIYTSRTIQFC